MPVAQKQARTRPILFSAPMVRAILRDKKTQTRRIVKVCPKDDGGFFKAGRSIIPERYEAMEGVNVIGTREVIYLLDGMGLAWHPHGGSGDVPWPSERIGEVSPYGAPGDRLWVRETFSTDARSVYPCDPVLYRADVAAYPYSNDDPANAEHISDCNGNRGDCYACLRERRGFKWKPSIFMRPEHSRIMLEITGVRVERLQAITEEDAQAEGVDGKGPVGYIPAKVRMGYCRYDYATLWDEINEKRAPWESNPWVWVVEFKRVRP